MACGEGKTDMMKMELWDFPCKYFTDAKFIARFIENVFMRFTINSFCGIFQEFSIKFKIEIL